MSVALMAATLLQRLRFVPLAPANEPIIPTTYDITMNFDRWQGLRMAVQPRAVEAVQPPSSQQPTPTTVA